MIVFAASASALASPIAPPGQISRVAVVGGTHGNEKIGPLLLELLDAQPGEADRPSFETLRVLANPDAIAANRRYVDVDLNRCFTHEILGGAMRGVEPRRARELDALLGPKASASPRVDLCLDVHTTTSAMGLSLMMDRADGLALECAAHLRRRLFPTPVHIVFWAEGRDEASTLPTAAASGMTVEVGPLPNGVATAQIFRQTRELLRLALDWVEERNRAAAAGTLKPKPAVLRGYQRVAVVPYPRDDAGRPLALVHDALQGHDYCAVRPDTPVFSRSSDGADLRLADVMTPPPTHSRRRRWWEPRAPPLHALFVNEAAYYEKDIAFALAEVVEARYTAGGPQRDLHAGGGDRLRSSLRGGAFDPNTPYDGST